MFRESQEIGQYKLIRKLGKGGFGEVWLAEKRSQFVTKRVAVKLPLDDQVNFEAIRQEATLWEQASGHANVLPIIDADVYDGQVVIVSEYADGGSLHDKLKTEGKLPIKQAVEMTIGILNGLEFLHNKRIIHRDIKPQNILLQGDTPRLADFGISRAMQTTAISSTIIGTDAYMSPEAFDGKRSVQTDIWAVGVVLYQLLKGILPFPQEHPSERMFAIIQKDFEPLPGEAPFKLQQIIKKALAKLPENRFESASQMRDDLQHFVSSIQSTVNVQNQPTEVLLAETMPSPKFVASIPNENPSVATVVTPQPVQYSVPKENQVDGNGVTFTEVQKTNKSYNSFIVMGAVAFVLIGVISLAIIINLKTFGQSEPTKVASANIGKTSSNSTTPNLNTNSASANTVVNSNQTVNVSNTNVANSSTNIADATNADPPKPTPDKVELQKLVNSFILKESKKGSETESKNLRKIIYGDLDGDGDEDAVVKYVTSPDSGGSMASYFGVGLIVYRNEDGKFEYVTEENVGGTFLRTFELVGLKNNKIIGKTERCRNPDDEDSAGRVDFCISNGTSVKGSTQYTLKGDKLTEK
jgi:serine/threonine protein kinase